MSWNKRPSVEGIEWKSAVHRHKNQQRNVEEMDNFPVKLCIAEPSPLIELARPFCERAFTFVTIINLSSLILKLRKQSLVYQISIVYQTSIV